MRLNVERRWRKPDIMLGPGEVSSQCMRDESVAS